MVVVYEGDPLPEDLMIEVLSLLPVKTMLRFKCVCKSWSAIITSPRIISKHYCNNKNGRLLVMYGSTSYEVPDLIELFQDATLVDLSHQRLKPPMIGLICGPCNGIFYLDYCCCLRDSGIWNPATKEFKLLPKKITMPDIPAADIYFKETFGFGLDPVSNDYKVVIIQDLWFDRSCSGRSPVIVYSLRTDSWKYWGELTKDYCLRNSTCYTYVNGVYYWWALTEVILAFDMAAEIFQEIQMPEYEKPILGELALYYDSIAVLTFHQVQKFLDIWVINEGCWIKQFSVGPLLNARNPVGYWKNGEVILESQNEGLILCNPISQEIKDLEIQGSYQCIQILIYKESLVSIKDGIECSQREEF